ncbi:MAG TPA: DegT/DnrJ/EryC1/StrS family aminotransferase [Vicinamibacteria bacterium]|nr:DegT/DnrJ/EryC1/StrS family aminotransferase [Vicinamibacteria bacterium]
MKLGEPRVPFNDLRLAEPSLARDVARAIDRVVASSWFILGPEVEAFEREYAAAFGFPHAVGVASGTDAITLALAALGVGRGDEVVTSPLTAAFTALAISRLGAVPVLADVEDGALTLAPASVEASITRRTKALVPVHLYGNACDMDGLMAVAERNGLAVVEDACQAHGARYRGRPLGGIGHAGAFSFYPTKNLGGFGDGGLVISSDPAVAEKVRRLRNGGQSSRYVHEEVGLNSRLDELQAAILRAKLPYLQAWNDKRRAHAARYDGELSRIAVRARPECLPARHLYVVRTQEREQLIDRLRAERIQALVHYPVPVHLQPAYRYLGQGPGACPVAESASAAVVSLPLYPSLETRQIDHVIASVMR